MKISLTVVFSLLQLLFVPANATRNSFDYMGEKFQISIKSPDVVVRKNGEIELVVNAAINEVNSIFFMDYNFDGYPDIAVLRDSGVERYFDVYLFSKKTRKFKKNETLSQLACPFPNLKRKTLMASCYHASACETWSDTYKYLNGSPVLIRRDGRNCDPISGQGFKYYEIYKNGRVIHQKSVPIIEKIN